MAYIGKEPAVGNFQVCDAISVVNGQAAYTMQVSSTNVVPESANHMLVSLNGILQKPNSSFTVSGSTITFASNLATGDVIDFIMLLGNVLDIGTPSDSTVTNAKTNFVSTSSSAGLSIKGDSTTPGTLQLNCEQNSHGVKLRSPAHSSGQSYTLTLPTGNVTADKFLKVASVSGSGTTGIGQLSFADAGGGITNAQEFLLTSNKAGTNSTGNYITSNISENATASYGAIGSNVSQSSGIFSFSATGIYLVTFEITGVTASTDDFDCSIDITTNNSTYTSRARKFFNPRTSEPNQFQGTIQTIVDVTDTSNVKLKFNISTTNPCSSSVEFYGSSTDIMTGFRFIRLANT